MRYIITGKEFNDKRKMTKKELKTFSLICLIISMVVFAVNYFVFHFISDEGIRAFSPEAGKPFVSMLIGIFGTLFMFTAVLTFIISLVKGEKENV